MTPDAMSRTASGILASRQAQAEHQAKAHGHTLGDWKAVTVGMPDGDIPIGAIAQCQACTAAARVRIAGGPDKGVQGEATTNNCDGEGT